MPYKDVAGLVEKLKTQKGIVIEQKVIPGANHFFDSRIEPLMAAITAISTAGSRRWRRGPKAEAADAPSGCWPLSGEACPRTVIRGRTPVRR